MTLAGVPAGKSEIVTASIVGFATNIDAVPDFVPSCVEVAVMIADPAAVGVNIPEEVIVPLVADHVTPVLYVPVPVTVAVHVEVCVVRMDAGEQLTETKLTVTGAVTVTVVVPDFVESWAEVAVMVAVPAPAGVNMPAALIVPILVGLTDHVTAEL